MPMSEPVKNKVTPQLLREFKEQNKKVALLTAYDYLFASIEDKIGMDVILVGDSLGMTVLGYESTLPVTMADMLRACKSVTRAVKRAMVIADMPYMSYQPSVSLAIKNAGRFISEANVDGVKLEGAGIITERIKAIVDVGIPVMGHLGLTPQSIKKFGGYKVQGKTTEEQDKLVNSAIELEGAGVFCIILECIRSDLVKEIKKAVKIPVYGIGAGSDCDGQILVVHDILGLYQGKLPKYVKEYANLTPIIENALQQYVNEVKESKYPDSLHSY